MFVLGSYDHFPPCFTFFSQLCDHVIIWENFPDCMEFQSWKANFKTELCSKSTDPHLTMQVIKQVEMAKSIDYLMTSQSITRRKDFSDYDVIDAMIASAVKKTSRQACSLLKKSKCRRTTCSKIRPNLTRETNCLHDLQAFPCNWSL